MRSAPAGGKHTASCSSLGRLLFDSSDQSVCLSSVSSLTQHQNSTDTTTSNRQAVLCRPELKENSKKALNPICQSATSTAIINLHSFLCFSFASENNKGAGVLGRKGQIGIVFYQCKCVVFNYITENI